MSALTPDQLNLIRAINSEATDQVSAQAENAALSTADVIAKINNWVTGTNAAFRWNNTLTGQQAQLDLYTGLVASSQSVIASIAAIQALITAQNPPQN